MRKITMQPLKHSDLEAIADKVNAKAIKFNYLRHQTNFRCYSVKFNNKITGVISYIINPKKHSLELQSVISWHKDACMLLVAFLEDRFKSYKMLSTIKAKVKDGDYAVLAAMHKWERKLQNDVWVCTLKKESS